MPTNEKTPHTQSNSVFIHFKPAELRQNQRWLIVYYALNPLTNIMERFRVNVPVIKSKTERLKIAKKMQLEINNKLYSGWLPYYNSNQTQFKTFEQCKALYLNIIDKEVKTGAKRIDTKRSIASFFSMLEKYVKEKGININLMLHFNKSFVVNYLDWVYYERENTARTYNNHLMYFNIFINWCCQRGFVTEVFTTGIKRLPKEVKKRKVLTDEVKLKVKHIANIDKHYYTLCMMTYYCFVRRTELTKLKVSAINLNGGYMMITNDESKNKKTEAVTIPIPLLELLAEHLQKAKNDDYLFSADNFKPGKIQLAPKKISDEWNKYRKLLNIGTEFQFYSLKDTGITDLLNTGIPAIKVRDQARHHDLRITEQYTSRNQSKDEAITNANFNF